MLRYWYKDYLRMIHPRSPEEEIQYTYGETNVVTLIEGSRFWFEIFRHKLLGLSQPSRADHVRSDQSIQSLIEWLGALQTTLLKSQISSETVAQARQVVEDFVELIQRESEKMHNMFQDEIDGMLTKGIIKWCEFVTQCLQEKGTNEYEHYWDKKTQKLIMYDGTEDYVTFLERVWSDPNLLVAWDYWDYQDHLAERYFLSRTIQLAEGYCEIMEYQRKLQVLDDQLKGKIVKYDKLLAKDKKKYFPISYFWWYYTIPQGMILYNHPE